MSKNNSADDQKTAHEIKFLQQDKRKLELEILDLKDTVSHLKIENNKLLQELAAAKRIRGASKLFARAVDSAINTQLDKIDSGGVSKRPAHIPKIDALSFEKLSAHDALLAVQEWDREVLPKTQNIVFEKTRSKTYKAVSSTYRGSKKIAKGTVKKSLSIARKAKRGIR